MKVYNAHNNTALIDRLLADGVLHPSRVVFDFQHLVQNTGMVEPESILIMWNGYYYICPIEIVRNAWQREEALAKHSEHYRTGDMFSPTEIRLSQCLHVQRDQIELCYNSLDCH